MRVSADLKTRLKREARRLGAKESDLVRDAVEFRLAQAKKPVTAYEIFQKAGVVGYAKGLRPDLSANKNYMDGFGRSASFGGQRRATQDFC